MSGELANKVNKYIENKIKKDIREIKNIKKGEEDWDWIGAYGEEFKNKIP